MSKLFHCLSVMAIAGAAVVGSPQPTKAGNLPPRAGKSDFPPEPECWAPNGGTVTNTCDQEKNWYMPLVSVPAGTFWVTVNVLAPTNSNVQCMSTGTTHDGSVNVQLTGFIQVMQRNQALDIPLPTSIPSGGTGMVDCRALPGGKLNSLSW